MTKTVNSNYLSITAPGNSFFGRISQDSDPFARNDIDALGSALDLHTHENGKGLPVGALTATATVSGGGTLTFPTSTDTLVAKATTDVLTNKTLTSPVINGSVSGTAGFGAWLVWTPTLNQGGAVAFTVNIAHYVQVGKTILVELQITSSAAGVGANDIIVGGFPVAPIATNADLAVGAFRFDGAATRIGAVCMVTAATFKFQVDNQAGFLGTAPNVALANTNVLTFQAAFEAA